MSEAETVRTRFNRYAQAEVVTIALTVERASHEKDMPYRILVNGEEVESNYVLFPPAKMDALNALQALMSAIAGDLVLREEHGEEELRQALAGLY